MLSFCIDTVFNLAPNAKQTEYHLKTRNFHTRNPTKLLAIEKPRYYLRYDERLPEDPVYIKQTAIDNAMLYLTKKQRIIEENTC